MGTSIHFTLGWINAKPEKHNSLSLNSTIDITNAVISKHLSLSNFTFEKYDPEAGFYPGYSIYSWLGDVRRSVKPLRGSSELAEESSDSTRKFINIFANARSDDCKCPLGDAFYDFVDGDYGFQFFTLAELLFFDYDQVLAEVIEDSDSYQLNADGQTYRATFPGVWFTFLDYCKSRHVDFILVSFDS